MHKELSLSPELISLIRWGKGRAIRVHFKMQTSLMAPVICESTNLSLEPFYDGPDPLRSSRLSKELRLKSHTYNHSDGSSSTEG